MSKQEITKFKTIEGRKADAVLGKADSLEEQFSRSEAMRQQVEQRKQLKQRGLPSVDEQKLVDLDELRQVFADRLEAQSFQRVSALMDFASSAADIKEKLSGFEVAADIQTQKHEENTVLLRDIYGQLEKMIQMLTQEVADRQKQRDLEFSTLQKLNRYMDNWL